MKYRIDKMPCLMCGQQASYYRYGNNKRQWPQQTTTRVGNCPHCRQQPGLQGRFRVIDDRGVLILQSVQRQSETLRCGTCGDDIPYQRKAKKLCRDCAGENAVAIQIRQCEFSECPYGSHGSRAWLVCAHGMSGARYRTGQKFCSKDCATRRNKRDYARRRAERLRDPNARQRTAKKSQRLRVAFLHGYRCAECRRLIDVSKPVGHPDALEIDHIVPVSEGGKDNLGNLRPLHRRCHQRRTEAAQLGLDMG